MALVYRRPEASLQKSRGTPSAFGCLGQASLIVASVEWFFIHAQHVQFVYAGVGVEVGIDVDRCIIIDVIISGAKSTSWVVAGAMAVQRPCL
jgi:hypothetical protein